MATMNTGQEGFEPYRRGDTPSRKESRAEKTEKRTVYATAAGSSTASLAGGGAVVLAILALAGVIPGILTPIAAIALGAAFLLEGMAIGASYAHLGSQTTGRVPAGISLAGGTSPQTLGGIAGITLGVLALIGVERWPLLAISAIVFGATLVLGGAARPHITTGGFAMGSATESDVVTREATHATTSAMTLAGLASVTLGILAIAGIGPGITLTMVSFLVVGATALMAGAALMGRAQSARRA